MNVFRIVAIVYCRPNPDGEGTDFKLITGYSVAGTKEWALANVRQQRMAETIGAGYTEVCTGTKTIDRGFWSFMGFYFWEIACYYRWRALRFVHRIGK